MMVCQPAQRARWQCHAMGRLKWLRGWLSIPDRRRCGYHWAGHEVHWIQGLKAANDSEQAAIPGRLVNVSDDGSLVLEIGGETILLWNHGIAPIRRSAFGFRPETTAEGSACR